MKQYRYDSTFAVISDYIREKIILQNFKLTTQINKPVK